MNTNPVSERGMLGARLHGPKDMRVERLPSPPRPGPGQVLLRTSVTSICGSDLHTYLDGYVGDTALEAPLVLGHEFSGVVETVGPDGSDGDDQALKAGQRVAVDPAQPCGRCEFCEKGHPNLCRRLHFCGLYPDDGSLQEWMLMPTRCCFPLPDTLNDIEGALLEPLGIALHAVNLAKLKVGESVTILGAGPIGLLILRLAALSGAHPIVVTDPHGWRLDFARRWGADLAIHVGAVDPVKAVMDFTHSRGVDVVIEAAWGAETVEQSAEMACLGGRIVLVGIPRQDQLLMRASAARRKGLTIKLSRRMKHTYPQAISLALRGQVDLMSLVTHRFSLSQAPAAFALNADYRDKVIKVVIETGNAG
ncbi:MAG TPA: alcohol dehydrogenase catalytic domain-containing protein [Terriglobia bacterium]|nr:alcohol dehydrogenase catalytic domain-containing protein [Terriglobia bacterium]